MKNRLNLGKVPLFSRIVPKIPTFFDKNKKVHKKSKYFYSLLKDSTGSFLLATRDGISPAIIVKTTLIIIKITAPIIGKLLIFDTPATLDIIILIGILSIIVVKIPSIPDDNPTINVSTLNTRDTSFLLAPIALKIPIYFVLSITEI